MREMLCSALPAKVVDVNEKQEGQGPDEEPYETLYIIDNRSEMLFIYGMDGGANPRLALRGGSSLPALFRAARGG